MNVTSPTPPHRSHPPPPQDWNDGRIPYYTLPPERPKSGLEEAVIVSSYAQEFNADEVGGLTLNQSRKETVALQGETVAAYASCGTSP